MNRKTILINAIAAISIGGLVVVPGLSQAAQGVNFYAGADVAQLTSELAPSGVFLGIKAEFTTQHLRLKGGVNVQPWLAIEAQLLNDAEDSDVNSPGVSASHSTGTIFGVFARPHATFGPVDIYGMLGYATAKATLDCVPSCPPQWKSTLDGFAYGIGAQYLATKQLKFSLDYMVYHDGSVTYDDGLTPLIYSDTKTSGIGLGINYTF